MSKEIRIPRLGWSMDEGRFMGWLKRSGEKVSVGDPLFELEGEKASQDIESVDAGVLFIPANGPKSGDTIAVGALLGYLLEGNETPESMQTATLSPTDLVSDPSPASSASPSLPTQATQAAVQASSPSVTNRNSETNIVATPRAKRLAAEMGIDWGQVQGSGKDGRIREADVRDHAGGKSIGRRVTLSPRRKAIAEKMRRSAERTVPVTLHCKMDVSSLVEYRKRMKEETGKGISWSVLFAKLASIAIQEHPFIAGRWVGTEQIEIADPNQLSIGLAVDTPEGLVVPVLHDVMNKDVIRLNDEAIELFIRAKDGTIKQNDLQGASFTITSLGSFGIDAFTPIINYPETAILGLGALHQDGSGSWITLSLTFDHCAMDGAPAARFLQCLTALKSCYGQICVQDSGPL